MSGELNSICSTSSLRLEADSTAGTLVSDTDSAVTSVCEKSQSSKTLSTTDTVKEMSLPTVDSAKEVSITDGAARREAHPRTGNLSIVSEESGLKSSSHGGLLCSSLSLYVSVFSSSLCCVVLSLSLGFVVFS